MSDGPSEPLLPGSVPQLQLQLLSFYVKDLNGNYQGRKQYNFKDCAVPTNDKINYRQISLSIFYRFQNRYQAEIISTKNVHFKIMQNIAIFKFSNKFQISW